MERDKIIFLRNLFLPGICHWRGIRAFLFHPYLCVLAYLGILGEPSVQNRGERVWKLSAAVLSGNTDCNRISVFSTRSGIALDDKKIGNDD